MKLLILIEAVLQKLDLVSQVLHILADLFNLSSILNHKSVCVDSFLNRHCCQDLHSIVRFILQAV